MIVCDVEFPGSSDGQQTKKLPRNKITMPWVYSQRSSGCYSIGSLDVGMFDILDQLHNIRT